MTASPPPHASTAQGVLRRQYLHSFVAAACIGPFLSYVLADIGWTALEIGYATAVLTASSVAAAPLWGWIDDRRAEGAARISLVATAVAAVSVATAIGGPNRWLALAAIALLGACSGSLEPLLTARALRSAPSAHGLGAVRSVGSIGWILGLGVGGLLLTVAHQQPALIFLLAGAAALSAPVSRGLNPPVATSIQPLKSRQIPIREVLGVLSMTFPVPLCMAVLVFFTAGWARSAYDAGPLLAVGPLALSAALELPAFLLVDRLSKRVSATWLCGAAYVPLVVATVLLALLPGEATIFAVQPLIAAGFALWFVGHSRLMADRVSARHLATALTLLSTLSRGIAGPVAGLAGGAIAAAAGYPMLFLTMSGVCVLGLLRVLLTARGQDQGPDRRNR